uniref:Calponin-homology (CH) domain-containing protein n=1 Tax=Periophthalmus magnuspinnatus TaxID=409849 RepID=A0A3B3ZG28_9GOBI
CVNENLAEQKFESLLCCAVQEIHMDLKEFGKQLEQSLDEAAAKVAPLAQTLVQLQEESKILKSEQERLAKEVEVLCLVMGLQDLQTSIEDPSKVSNLLNSPLRVPQGSVFVPQDALPPATPTAMSTAKPEERPGKVTPETLAAIEDEELLDKMLDESKDFEERKLIRAAMRDLRKRKRDQRDKERESRLQELRQQKDQKTASRGGAGTGEVVIRKLEKSADGNTLSQVTKTERFAQSDDGSRSSCSTMVETSYVQKTDMSDFRLSVFDREDDSLSRGGSLAAMERRQAERRKELMRAQTMPKSSMQARKAMMERLDKDAAINRVQRSTSFGVPNANSIKQMLLDWCRAKTRSYEHVDIHNFSSSWSNGMAFCALVHHFFPEAFDYSSLNPSERRHNFDLAFSTAERMVDCPQLLDVDDMVKMREPDWKCVYTYLQEFYRGLVTKGLVKTRGNS